MRAASAQGTTLQRQRVQPRSQDYIGLSEHSEQQRGTGSAAERERASLLVPPHAAQVRRGHAIVVQALHNHGSGGQLAGAPSQGRKEAELVLRRGKLGWRPRPQRRASADTPGAHVAAVTNSDTEGDGWTYVPLLPGDGCCCAPCDSMVWVRYAFCAMRYVGRASFAVRTTKMRCLLLACFASAALMQGLTPAQVTCAGAAAHHT